MKCSLSILVFGLAVYASAQNNQPNESADLSSPLGSKESEGEKHHGGKRHHCNQSTPQPPQNRARRHDSQGQHAAGQKQPESSENDAGAPHTRARRHENDPLDSNKNNQQSPPQLPANSPQQLPPNPQQPGGFPSGLPLDSKNAGQESFGKSPHASSAKNDKESSNVAAANSGLPPQAGQQGNDNHEDNHQQVDVPKGRVRRQDIAEFGEPPQASDENSAPSTETPAEDEQTEKKHKHKHGHGEKHRGHGEKHQNADAESVDENLTDAQDGDDGSVPKMFVEQQRENADGGGSSANSASNGDESDSQSDEQQGPSQSDQAEALVRGGHVEQDGQTDGDEDEKHQSGPVSAHASRARRQADGSSSLQEQDAEVEEREDEHAN